MVFLPYVPTPYPDEVLCSVLTRFVVHNGESVFRKISNSVAHLSPNLSIYQASPPHPAVVAFITDQMGLPGNEVTDRLTTSQFFRVWNTKWETSVPWIHSLQSPTRCAFLSILSWWGLQKIRWALSSSNSSDAARIDMHSSWRMVKNFMPQVQNACCAN